MSVAFRRESDEEHLEPKFELPIPPGPNYVTPAGLAQIEQRVAELEAAIHTTSDEEPLKALKRDLRYWHNRQSTAQIAPVPHKDEAGIGSRVTFRLRGERQAIDITGYDEADPAHGRIAFSAPLARALMGTGAGDFAEFAGEDDALEVIEVSTV